MLRVHFTAEDLARVRVAPGPDPMWEILLSLHVLRQRSATPVFGTWRANVRTTLPDDARWLMQLAPPVGYSPDFLTPTAGSCALDAGIDAVLNTPTESLKADLAQLDGQHRDPRTQLLASGDVATLDSLGEALRAYHRHALAPVWHEIRAGVDADRAVRARTYLDSGCEGMLSALHPTISWTSPVLRIESRFPQRDVHLHGQGLVLVPSYFCWERPIMLRDQRHPPVLVYPIARDLHVATGKRSLEALLGRTRAAALEVIAGGCTTTELARRLGISAASASAHASVLRDAGLAVAQRHRNSVLHTASALGVELLA